VCFIYAAIFGCHIFALLLVPESPAWLFSVGKPEAARHSLIYMGRSHEIEEQERHAHQVKYSLTLKIIAHENFILI